MDRLRVKKSIALSIIFDYNDDKHFYIRIPRYYIEEDEIRERVYVPNEDFTPSSFRRLIKVLGRIPLSLTSGKIVYLNVDNLNINIAGIA